MKQLALAMRLRAGAVFESFAPGQNQEIITALRKPDTTPLWLWGAAGSGKTHLLQAVCSAAGQTAAYFPLGPKPSMPPEALAGFEHARVLCIDDVDAVAGVQSWEEALFRLFNEAAELRTRLIFAAAVAPRQSAWRLEDWRSRAASCVVYQLRELDDQGRTEALRLRAAQRGLDLPRETSEYLLKRMPRDLPSLFDILDTLDEASLVAQRRLTVPFIRAALEKHAKTKS
jgi:DnaA-homolog protein